MIKLDKKKFNLQFDEKALDQLKLYQQKNRELESGGILLGEVYLESSRVIVKEALVSKNAKRSYCGVKIDKKEMQMELDKKREESDYKLYYIGDWHTHPEPFPKPSFIDKKSYFNIVRKTRILTNFIVFLIIGNAERIEKSMHVDVKFLTS